MSPWVSGNSLTPSTLNSIVPSWFSSAVSLDLGVFNVKDYGAKGDGATNDTAAIINATVASSAVSGRVLFPFGTYVVVPATPMIGAYATTAAVPMLSNMHIWGYGATIKLADNQSTNAMPKKLEIFFANSAVTNVSFHGVAFDMNGANNPISPNRPTYNQYNQASIGIGGDAGLAANVLVEDCSFANNAGVNNIVMAQSNTVGIPIGSGWVVRGCRFVDNGTDSDDLTSVYGWADDVLLEGNTFSVSASSACTGAVGAHTAFEIHGARHRVVGNVVNNYLRAGYVAGNLSSNAKDSVIVGNAFATTLSGLEFVSGSTNEVVGNITIVANDFVISNDTLAPGGTKFGVSIAPSYALSDILVSGNAYRSLGTRMASLFCYVSASAVTGQTITGVIVDGNKALGGAGGVQLRANSAAGLGLVRVTGNTFQDMSPAGGNTPLGVITSGGTISFLDISNNAFIDDRGAGALMNYGINLGGVIGTLVNHGNSYVSMTTANYTETATIGNKVDGYASPDFGFLSPSGSATTPGFAFSSETSLGFYRSAASSIDLSYGTLTASGVSTPNLVVGANGATINGNLGVASNAVIGTGAGTVGFPGYNFTSESSLGFFRSTSSTIKQSFGTFDLSAANLSVKTTGTSLTSITIPQGGIQFFVGGASGATMALRSGGTIYFFASSSSTVG